VSQAAEPSPLSSPRSGPGMQEGNEPTGGQRPTGAAFSPAMQGGSRSGGHHRSSGSGRPRRRLADDPQWYRKAVFYEVFVRGFYDSNDDGSGDLPGLIEKLDYLAWLGIDCLWLLPFYQSPMRDGGYDISDFFTVLPEYGLISDVFNLVEQAHRRGIRVIADLVMNHTSDQHPWFIESRSSRDNPKADWYVWSDDDQRWPEARIIFTDVEKSNWAWDEKRQQYYWHRFYAHQPDLNYENPDVQDAMLNVVRFWLDVGLDGFRLDAVPYLFQADGTTCENLPETHAYLKRVRAEVDRSYPNRVLLAEANQPPEELIAYFGNSDECHMCFNFPLMPRTFVAVKQENRQPLVDIVRRTPELPEGCQWGTFLRNHDELTLEKVTEEERDILIGAYATDPRAKRHTGICRRLAPLIDNDQALAKLLHALLLSLPGSPILYYGDEILLGDNIYLGDRDAVRTPMQWTPDRNGGFSRADPAQLYLQPLMDPVYGYQALNVESETRNPASFLHWLRRMLEVRHAYELFGTGDLELVDAANQSVFAFLRTSGNRVVLCVNNLSRLSQPAELDLAAYAGRLPVEMLGRVPFPRVSTSRYFVTLAGHGFFWFELVSRRPRG
jgi:maltose alpha-D-glucosyltransferase/alpha-amylase